MYINNNTNRSILSDNIALPLSTYLSNYNGFSDNAIQNLLIENNKKCCTTNVISPNVIENKLFNALLFEAEDNKQGYLSKLNKSDRIEKIAELYDAKSGLFSEIATNIYNNYNLSSSEILQLPPAELQNIRQDLIKVTLAFNNWIGTEYIKSGADITYSSSNKPTSSLITGISNTYLIIGGIALVGGFLLMRK